MGTPYDASMYVHMTAQRIAISPKENALILRNARAPMRPSGYSKSAATSRGDVDMSPCEYGRGLGMGKAPDAAIPATSR